MTTIYDYLLELSTYVTVDQETKDKAFSSLITDENNDEFAEVLNDWIDGAYDEDPETPLSIVKTLLG